MISTLEPSPATQLESASCPQCEQTLRREDIVITARPSGLGKPRRQHVEGHCRHCKIMASFDRQFDGTRWQQITGVTIKPASELSAAEQKRRADLERAMADRLNAEAK